MRRMLAARLVASLVVMAGTARVTNAQGGVWNDSRSRALVELATQRRTEQLADTGLLDYRADARGYVTFLAALGDGFLETPKVVKTDELAVEVYWHAPNLSKQRIIGRRDTLLLPTDIQYHRDHLAIVQNNGKVLAYVCDGRKAEAWLTGTATDTNDGFVPRNLTIHAGERVTWRSGGVHFHTVSFGIDPRKTPLLVPVGKDAHGALPAEHRDDDDDDAEHQVDRHQVANRACGSACVGPATCLVEISSKCRISKREAG